MEQEVKFESGQFQLSGTLLIPETKSRRGIVLLLAGSGQTDRDDNAKQLQINALKYIAEYLCDLGFASYRYDKRGVGASEGNHWETGFYDHIQDAAAALDFLKAEPRLAGGPVFVLGHSEGALISTRLAATYPGLAGAILLAGSAQTGEEIMRWQAAKIAKGLKGVNAFIIKLFHVDVLKAQDKALRKIKASPKDSMRQGLVKKRNARWMREFMAYDPSMDMIKIQIPVLAITGSKDIQVNPADLSRMSGIVKGDLEYHEIPDMTHLLRPEAGEPSTSTYKEQVKRPLELRLLQFIGSWLDKHTPSGDASQYIVNNKMS
jgi:pimeloyl-ACP methyl ester carboxylesterase